MPLFILAPCLTRSAYQAFPWQGKLKKMTRYAYSALKIYLFKFKRYHIMFMRLPCPPQKK